MGALGASSKSLEMPSALVPSPPRLVCVIAHRVLPCAPSLPPHSVMEAESFESEEVARLMNQHFVSIKVGCAAAGGARCARAVRLRKKKERKRIDYAGGGSTTYMN